MLLDPTKTVRELALALPNATRVFEKTKIDYCCGGDQLLGAACAAAGVDLRELEGMLEEASMSEVAGNGARDFQQLTLAELITHILDKHHVYTKDEMERLEPLSARVATAHGENHPELVEIRDLLQHLFADLRQHMFKEEQILFPFICQLEQCVLHRRRPPFAPFGSVNCPIRMMMMEHDTAGDVLREMRKLSVDYKPPADACISYKTLYEALEAFEQDLHQHIHLENNVLFPKAVELEERLFSR